MRQTLDEQKSSEVGLRIAQAARARGISQRSLAKASGVSLSRISIIFAGTARLRSGTVVRIAEALRVPATYLFHGGEMPPVTENTREPMHIMVGEGEQSGYGQNGPPPEGVTMAQAMQVIAQQLAVPIDRVREAVTGLLRSEAEVSKLKG